MQRTRSSSPVRRGSVGPSGTSTSTATRACEFCRRRKIRCDGNEPCDNCTKRNRACEYVAREQLGRPRPSRSHVQSLEAEVRSLREYIARLQEATHDKRDELLSNYASDEHPALGSTSGGSASRASRALNSTVSSPQSHAGIDESPSDIHATRQFHVAVDVGASLAIPYADCHGMKLARLKCIDCGQGQTAFHGHTSIFEQHDHTSATASDNSATRPAYTCPDDRSLAQGLLGDAAGRGRHQEILDLAAGRLDFDGVDAETAMELLAIHWNRQHHALLLTYRPAFMRDMAVPGGGRYFSKLLLNAIYFGASKFSNKPQLRADPDDPRTAGFQFLKRINGLMGEAITRSRIPTVQALLLLASSLFALGQHESSWLYSGLAFRMIVDLGLHIDNSAFDKSLSAEDVEIRRRVLYGSFCFDKIHSLYQGRPPTLQEVDINVPLVFNDLYEEGELWRPTTFPSTSGTAFRAGVATHSVTTFTAMCKLCSILGKALNALYSFQSFGYTARRHLENLHLLDGDLDRFERELPDHLKIDYQSTAETTAPSNILALHAVWQTLIIIVRRPFVAQGHLRDLGNEVAERSWQKCVKAAERMSDLLRIYKEALGFQRSPFLISYCAYIAATILVRMAAQGGPTSNAMRRLQFAMEVFKETETINTGVTKAKEVLLSLMQRLQVPYEVDSSATARTDTNDTRESVPDLAQQNIDMDALLRSFTGANGNNSANGHSHVDHQPFSLLDVPTQGWPSDGLGSIGTSNAFFLPGFEAESSEQDVLYGLMSGGNLSGYDGLFRSHNL